MGSNGDASTVTNAGVNPRDVGSPRGIWKTGYGALPHYSEVTWTTGV